MDLDKIPTLDRLSATVETLRWLSDRAGDLPEDSAKGVVMALQFTVSGLYIAELQKHMVDGMEPYDALLATVRGELQLTQSQRDLLNAVLPPRSATP